MSKDSISIREYLKKYDAGDFNKEDVDTQIDAGWYDWFCGDRALPRKTHTLTKKLKTIVNSKKINQDTMYVFFKNNCPCVGPLYDSFSICFLSNGYVRYWVCPKSGHTGKAEVCGPENGFEEPLAEGTWDDIVIFFNS